VEGDRGWEPWGKGGVREVGVEGWKAGEIGATLCNILLSKKGKEAEANKN